MRDLEIKGTGNSRYIKSSVPSTTTFDEFLTMLRAGNLPIDLMGLNTAGIITQSPSAYNKANVLPDDACDLLGLPSNTAEPKDAFMVLGLIQADVYARVILTVQTNTGEKISGVLIRLGSTNYYTDENGQVIADVPPQVYQITLTHTIDLTFNPTSFSLNAARGEITRRTIQATTVSNNQITITSSRILNFSNAVKEFDVFLVGGGGSGGAAVSCGGGEYGIAVAGGAGGYTTTSRNQVPNGQITVTIGAGGTSASCTHAGSGSGAKVYGNSGGQTKVEFGDVTITANGGAGGPASATNSANVSISGANGGSGSGGARTYRYEVNYAENTSYSSGYNGSSGGENSSTGQGTTTTAFSENSGTQYSPAGAGACTSYYNGIRSIDYGDRASNAASGILTTTTSSGQTITGNSASTAGGGGGGCALNNQTLGNTGTAISGAGRAGLVIIRWRYN